MQESTNKLLHLNPRLSNNIPPMLGPKNMPSERTDVQKPETTE